MSAICGTCEFELTYDGECLACENRALRQRIEAMDGDSAVWILKNLLRQHGDECGCTWHGMARARLARLEAPV